MQPPHWLLLLLAQQAACSYMSVLLRPAVALPPQVPVNATTGKLKTPDVPAQLCPKTCCRALNPCWVSSAMHGTD